MTALTSALDGVSKRLRKTASSCVLGSFGSLFSCEKFALGMPLRKLALIVLFSLSVSGVVMARGSYLTVPEFVANAFAGESPPVKTLWLSGELQQRLHSIFGHPYKSLRLRYWQQDAKTAWVLDEIGKELPITMGVVVNGGAIEQLRILTYRESRGAEVRHPFFTEQFEGARLGQGDVLDRQIDGITGATLSVRAVTRVAEAALVLAETVADDSAGE